MMQLKRCLGPVSPFSIHTDACKGLEKAVKTVFPHAEQRECFGHMWMNLIKKFRGDDFGRMWPAARSYTSKTYLYHMDKIMAACGDNNEFATWLENHHSLLWYRSGFNTAIKVDHINNLAESFNNWVKDLKDLPVHDMVDQIRIKIMRLWELRASLCRVLQGDKLPDVVQVLSTIAENLAICLLRNLHYTVVKLEIPSLAGGMLWTLKRVNAVASSGNTLGSHVSMP
jgi:hypothetical protein